MTQFSDDRGAELRELFFETAHELLQTLNDEALKLEKKPGDEEIIRSIRRVVHTLKGDAAAVGFRELSELAHELEDALALDAVKAHLSLADITFNAVDIFTTMLAAYSKNSELPSSESFRTLVKGLAQSPKAKKTSKNKKPEVSQDPWTEYEKLSIQDAASRGKRIYHVRTIVDPNCTMPIAARQLVLNALKEIGDLIASRPDASFTGTIKEIQILVATEHPSETIVQKCRIPTVISDVRIETVATAASKPEKKKAAAAAASQSPVDQPPNVQQRVSEISHPAPVQASEPAEETKRSVAVSAENILRVDAERIDNMLNLVGELIIGKSMLQQALNEFAVHSPKDPMRARFSDAMAFQSRVLNDLQRAVMKVRMVPVEQLFRRFPRMVRDVAKQCGKKVEIVMQGQDTDLDKSLLDAIAEPLTHLVRNAIGHGIESPEVRVRNGKPAEGTIRLDAYHQANQVVVEISDDGGGIDSQKIKSRAIERGMLTAEAAAKTSEAEILDFIFRPGFSTAEEVTEIAGRGVGLDVVQSVMARLKGSVEVQTQLGQGTCFRLRLPLTLAIIKALLFRVQHRLYAIPLNAVAEISRARESDLHQVDGREVLQLRDYVLPVIRLGKRHADVTIPGQDAKIFVLVIALGERKYGLLVDSLDGEEELVIKPLDDQTVNTDMVSGASILGDGRVVLILNLAAIVERFSKWRPQLGQASSFGILLSQIERDQLLPATVSEVRQ